jgi:hypothetical protein
MIRGKHSKMSGTVAARITRAPRRRVAMASAPRSHPTAGAD